MTDPTILMSDLRHAAEIIREVDIQQRRTRFVEALERHAQNIEDGKVQVLRGGDPTVRILGDLKAIRDGWINVAAHVRRLTPWEQECLTFIEATIMEVEG